LIFPPKSGAAKSYCHLPVAVQKFRDWTKAKYGSINIVNAAWGSKFASFDGINPEDDYGVEEGMKMVFNRMDRVFHDWSPAMADWDTFRTELRLDTIQKITDLVRKTIPNADMSIRTEGANLPIRVDPKAASMHMRHIYYSQQRQALVYDAVKRANVIRFYGDYTTLPYTEDEWRRSMKQMVADDITPVFLPQFDHMRDILINPYYGREYQMHYGLDEPAKGMMIHCLMAAYPWWKATYEEGGAPGIIGSDYLCDGFATETQKRELKYLNRFFKKMRASDAVSDGDRVLLDECDSPSLHDIEYHANLAASEIDAMTVSEKNLDGMNLWVGSWLSVRSSSRSYFASIHNFQTAAIGDNRILWGLHRQQHSYSSRELSEHQYLE